MIRRRLAALLLVGLPACSEHCSRSGDERVRRDLPREAGPPAVVAGSIAGHPFRARSAILVRSTVPETKDHHPLPPMLLLFETEASCANFDAAQLFEPHVRIRNLPNGVAPGRQRVWFDDCVRYDDARTPECLIQSNEAWLDLEPGSREIGARVRGRVELQREAFVKPEENGRIEGAFEAIVCDGNVPAGLKLREENDDVPE